MNCKKALIALLATTTLCISGCGAADNTESTDSSPVIDGLQTQEFFTNTVIPTDGETTAISLDEHKDTLHITKAGNYTLSGKMNGGQIVIDVAKTDAVRLILDGAHISSATAAALYIKQAASVTVVLPEGKTNTLVGRGASTADGNTNVDGAIFCKSDLVIEGSGSLMIEAPETHGIVCKGSLTVKGGDHSITAGGHALQCKGSVRIADGKFTLDATGDGIHAEDIDNADNGFVYIADGKYTINAACDGISASGILQIDNGSGTITCGGGHENAEAHFDSFSPFGGSYSANVDSISAKGLKSGGNMLLNNGTWHIDTADDAMHSNASMTIKGGALSISTGDDAMHANADLVISGGNISIDKSYEGLEGNTVTISGGEITLHADDDGINSAGGQDDSETEEFRMDPFSSDSSCYIRISGGKLTIDAAGDGIDSNGALIISGGETYVSGPTNNGNGTLDYGASAQISGGIFVAVGSSGMTQGFSEAEGQGAMLVNLSTATTESLSLKDSSGTVLLSYTPPKSYSSIILSCPSIKRGESYTLSVGDASTTITMSDWLYSNGGMGGRPGGDMGGPPNGGMGGRPERW